MFEDLETSIRREATIMKSEKRELAFREAEEWVNGGGVFTEDQAKCLTEMLRCIRRAVETQ